MKKKMTESIRQYTKETAIPTQCMGACRGGEGGPGSTPDSSNNGSWMEDSCCPPASAGSWSDQDCHIFVMCFKNSYNIQSLQGKKAIYQLVSSLISQFTALYERMKELIGCFSNKLWLMPSQPPPSSSADSCFAKTKQSPPVGAILSTRATEKKIEPEFQRRC